MNVKSDGTGVVIVALLWHSMQFDETFGTIPWIYVSRVVFARKFGAGVPRGSPGAAWHWPVFVGHIVLISS